MCCTYNVLYNHCIQQYEIEALSTLLDCYLQLTTLFFDLWPVSLLQMMFKSYQICRNLEGKLKQTSVFHSRMAFLSCNPELISFGVIANICLGDEQ